MGIDNDPTPSGELSVPVEDVRARLTQLLTIDNVPQEKRDFAFSPDEYENYDARSVQIDRDELLNAIWCTVLHPSKPGVYLSEDRYLLFDTGELVHEYVKTDYDYVETASRLDYDIATDNWKNYLKTLLNPGKLDELEELVTMDELTTVYQGVRDDYSEVLRGLQRKAAAGHDVVEAKEIAKAEYDFALHECAERIRQHFKEIEAGLTESERHYYFALFREVIKRFNKRADADLIAGARYNVVSIEANMRLEEKLSPDVDVQQAWALLKILDACQPE